MSTIDTIVYDFGGVLVGWDPYRAYTGSLTRTEVDQFFTDVDFFALNHTRDAGATWQDARAQVAATHPHQVPNIDRYVAHFAATLTGPIDGSARLVTELKDAGLRLFGLTNWSAELFHHAAAAATAITMMDDVIVSGHVGLAKPDPAIFELAITRFALDPARTVFIDDTPANIHTAAAAGFHTHTFTSTTALRHELIRHRIAIPAN